MPSLIQQMSLKTVIVACSRSSQLSREELLIAQSFDHGGLDRVATLDIVWENSEGLSKVYNRKMDQYAASAVEFIVFVHDDVYIDDLKIVEKLSTAHHSLGYDIVGVAGAAALNVAYPSLWHLMSEPKDRRGYVSHFAKPGQVVCSSYGGTPSRVVVADGLFLAVHLPTAVGKGWKFNENYDFHHYDLSSCLDAVGLGLRLGVYPIHLIHDSPGLDSLANPRWKASDQKFLSEYGGTAAGYP